MIKTGLLIISLVGCVFLGALVEVEAASAQRFRSSAVASFRHRIAPPESPDHGYRHFTPSGTEMIFDSQLSAYVVSGHSDRYFQGKRYLRRLADRWQASDRIEGPWKEISGAEISRGLQRRYAHEPRGKRPAAPAKQAP